MKNYLVAYVVNKKEYLLGITIDGGILWTNCVPEDSWLNQYPGKKLECDQYRIDQLRAMLISLEKGEYN